jgi:hypothetical protein
VFLFVTFKIGSHFMSRPAWTVIFLSVPPHLAGMTEAYHHAQPLVEMESYGSAWMALNHDLPNLCLPSSWDYGLKSPHLSCLSLLNESSMNNRKVSFYLLLFHFQNCTYFLTNSKYSVNIY